MVGLYTNAILETDNNKLELHIRAAEGSIAKRSSQHEQTSVEERMALVDARNALGVLKQERAHFVTTTFSCVSSFSPLAVVSQPHGFL
jgi:hypothetical protein